MLPHLTTQHSSDPRSTTRLRCSSLHPRHTIAGGRRWFVLKDGRATALRETRAFAAPTNDALDPSPLACRFEQPATRSRTRSSCFCRGSTSAFARSLRVVASAPEAPRQASAMGLVLCGSWLQPRHSNSSRSDFLSAAFWPSLRLRFCSGGLHARQPLPFLSLPHPFASSPGSAVAPPWHRRSRLCAPHFQWGAGSAM